MLKRYPSIFFGHLRNAAKHCETLQNTAKTMKGFQRYDFRLRSDVVRKDPHDDGDGGRPGADSPTREGPFQANRGRPRHVLPRVRV